MWNCKSVVELLWLCIILYMHHILSLLWKRRITRLDVGTSDLSGAQMTKLGFRYWDPIRMKNICWVYTTCMSWVVVALHYIKIVKMSYFGWYWVIFVLIYVIEMYENVLRVGYPCILLHYNIFWMYSHSFILLWFLCSFLDTNKQVNEYLL